MTHEEELIAAVAGALQKEFRLYPASTHLHLATKIVQDEEFKAALGGLVASVAKVSGVMNKQPHRNCGCKCAVCGHTKRTHESLHCEACKCEGTFV